MDEQTTTPAAPVEDTNSNHVAELVAQNQDLMARIQKLEAKNHEVIGEKRAMAEKVADPEALKYICLLYTSPSPRDS